MPISSVWWQSCFGFGFIIHVWQVMFRILEVWMMPSVYIIWCQKEIRLLWMLCLCSWAGQFMWLRLLSCLMRCLRKIRFLGVRDQLWNWCNSILCSIENYRAKYANNEVYVDLVEEMDATINRHKIRLA